jgi:transcriptional regulator with XRE-family HTH domain
MMRKNSLTLENNCLRKYRKARGLKQKEVALLLGLRNTSEISRWEKGNCLPQTINLFRLSIIYRTLIDALFIDTIRRLRQEIFEKEEFLATQTRNNN